ncbi:hypothetical protein BCR34DRAFT_578207 [Clohesyomyces aquaticus]|uniref:Uncharacterized protein n=1 Tax=Clohesyomyces aquaticus TaxID=1231657 RepID=A0A1Y1YGB8_9PLEO|nr:hypothetical protein BCR34DRAFT_578207 [Clohesyomyces aquaticus]
MRLRLQLIISHALRMAGHSFAQMSVICAPSAARRLQLGVPWQAATRRGHKKRPPCVGGIHRRPPCPAQNGTHPVIDSRLAAAMTTEPTLLCRRHCSPRLLLRHPSNDGVPSLQLQHTLSVYPFDRFFSSAPTCWIFESD